jgi:hypothetical protein
MAALRIVYGFSLLGDSRGFAQQSGQTLSSLDAVNLCGDDRLRVLPISTVGAPGNAVAGRVERVEALAGGDAGGLRVFAAEGPERRWAKRAEGGRVPRGGSEGGALDAEDERVGDRMVPGGVEGEDDLVPLLLPAGVPGLGVLAVPLLLEDRRTVGSELEDDGAMNFLGESAAAGVEALELGRGVSGGRESCAEQNQNGD